MGIAVQREDLSRLEPEWREALAASPHASVFLSPTWLRAWWEECGGERELVLLSARRDGQLAAVLPLMREGGRLSFAGDTQVCDYMDIVSPAGTDAAEVLRGFLLSLAEAPWDELELWAVREDSPTLPALAPLCREAGLEALVEEEDVCPGVELPRDWDEYIARLNKKDRHELRRKLRKLPQAGDVDLEVIGGDGPLEESLDDFVRMYAMSRPEKAAFLTPQRERFLRRIVRDLGREGLLELSFLRLAGKRVAGVLSFLGPGEMLLYNSGYDPDYAAFSVGLLSKALTLRRAIELGYERFDFLRGREPYKYDLGARDRKVHRITVRRP